MEGDQLPVIPLIDVVGNGAKVEPEHNGAMELKLGRVCAFTIMLSVAFTAHCPGLGINV